MKKLLVAGAFVVASVGVFGAAPLGGSFNANNRVTIANLDQPILSARGDTIVGTGWNVEILGGKTQDSLASVGVWSFRTAGSGYFNAGKQVLADVEQGTEGWLQIRVWDARQGHTSYADALAESFAKSLEVGESAPFSVLTGGDDLNPPQTPGNMVNMPGVMIAIVPEPATFALGCLGSVVLMMRRRR